jgi:hypothetical protein
MLLNELEAKCHEEDVLIIPEEETKKGNKKIWVKVEKSNLHEMLKL